MQLQHNKPNESYCEEDQDRPCHFWWAKVRKGKLETDHGPVLCRDFLGDTLVWKAKEQKPCSIYGWKFAGTIEKKYASLVLDDFGQIVQNVKNILNPIEIKIGIKPTTVEVTDDGGHVWVKGDKWWMTTTVHFSWYTTMLRYLTYDRIFHKLEDLASHHTNYWMRDAWPIFVKLPYALPKLKVVQVSGMKDPASHGKAMHDYNGWLANTDKEYKGKYTAYAEQLNGLLA